MNVSRRHFMKQAGAVALGFSGLHRLFSREHQPFGPDVPYGYGPMYRDPDGILDLPRGFSYRIVSRAGEEMADGFRVPGAPDGMAAFPGPDGLTLLVRNHEVSFGAPPESGPFGPANGGMSRLDRASLYDAGSADVPCLGGTTTLVYDTRDRRLVRQHLSLAGTLRNCAGGPTPWNSWITCEETVQRAGEGRAVDHGYNFEVPALADPSLARPIPLKAMGRFNHEAVAVEPKSGVVYETEDASDGLIYRFIPARPGRLAEGGRLQALAVADRPGLDTRNWQARQVRRNASLPVRWIDLEDVESPDNTLRLRGFEAGAARFARGEGMWYGRGAVFFACTNGGPARKGQIWRYLPSPAEGTDGERDAPARLELFVEAHGGALIENADNLTVSPWGDLVVCEDGPGYQTLIGVTPQGDVYKFGYNAASNAEFAGATFSPDGSTLFVNIQRDGLTLAITGPWRSNET